jgi:hypothetical protein
MLTMKLVFVLFCVPRDEQIKWVMKEARRNDTLVLARGFWNRASQRVPKATSSPRGIPVLRRADSVSLAELSGDAQEPRLPAA